MSTRGPDEARLTSLAAGARRCGVGVIFDSSCAAMNTRSHRIPRISRNPLTPSLRSNANATSARAQAEVVRRLRCVRPREIVLITRMSERLGLFARAHRRVFIATIVTLAVLIWSVAGGLTWFLGGIVTGLPNGEELRGVGTMSRATTIYDVHDQPAFTIFKERRIEVPLSKVSPAMIGAILAVEDQRFFDHGGVDVIRVAGAAWKNVREGWGTQGGSTITQQLARQSFLTPDKTVRRKLKEIVVAARLEDEFDKERILEMYLNKVYFGDGLYGVEAASLGYFGKHASEVSVAQAALLAGLVKAPSAYAPTVSIDRARARRNVVLQAMRDVKAIDGPTYDAAVREPVMLDDALRRGEAFGQYFKEEVRRFLVQRFGWERVYQGGLKVYTTVNLDMQRAAEAEVTRAIAEIEKQIGRASCRERV